VLTLLDNITRLLGDDLKRTVTPGAKLKIAASCFSIYAYEALKTELEQIESLEFIFTSPTFLPNGGPAAPTYPPAWAAANVRPMHRACSLRPHGQSRRGEAATPYHSTPVGPRPPGAPTYPPAWAAADARPMCRSCSLRPHG
jgi:hypothetical protein